MSFPLSAVGSIPLEVWSGPLAALPGLDLLDPNHLLETWGTLGLLLVVFVESGLLVGFFLPGDSLLFTAGLLAADGRLDLGVILVGVAVAAVAGDQVGYSIGRRTGPMLLARRNWIVTAERVERADRFFRTKGGRAIVLARFVSIVRTFTPVVAGAAGMPWAAFTRWNVVGGVTWGVGVTLAGYFLGQVVPGIDRYLLPIVVVIVVVSIVPAVRELRREADVVSPEPREVDAGA